MRPCGRALVAAAGEGAYPVTCARLCVCACGWVPAAAVMRARRRVWVLIAVSWQCVHACMRVRVRVSMCVDYVNLCTKSASLLSHFAQTPGQRACSLSRRRTQNKDCIFCLAMQAKERARALMHIGACTHVCAAMDAPISDLCAAL